MWRNKPLMGLKGSRKSMRLQENKKKKKKENEEQKWAVDQVAAATAALEIEQPPTLRRRGRKKKQLSSDQTLVNAVNQELDNFQQGSEPEKGGFSIPDLNELPLPEDDASESLISVPQIRGKNLGLMSSNERRRSPRIQERKKRKGTREENLAVPLVAAAVTPSDVELPPTVRRRGRKKKQVSFDPVLVKVVNEEPETEKNNDMHVLDPLKAQPGNETRALNPANSTGGRNDGIQSGGGAAEEPSFIDEPTIIPPPPRRHRMKDIAREVGRVRGIILKTRGAEPEIPDSGSNRIPSPQGEIREDFEELNKVVTAMAKMNSMAGHNSDNEGTPGTLGRRGLDIDLNL